MLRRRDPHPAWFGCPALLDELPANAQLKILDQANDMIGITPIPDIRSRIVELLQRRTRR
jgi:hypothetical protein